MSKKKRESYPLSYESDGKMGTKPDNRNTNGKEKDKDNLFSNTNQYSE